MCYNYIKIVLLGYIMSNEIKIEKVSIKNIKNSFFINQKNSHLLKRLEDAKECKNKTYFAMAYTESSVVVNFKCHYSGKLICNYSEFNSPVFRGEVVEIFISPYSRLDKYFEFDVSPNNVLFNAKITNFNNFDSIPALIEDTAVKTFTKILNDFYMVSIEIPFHLILEKFDSTKENSKWLFNAYRTDLSDDNKELCALFPTLKKSYHVSTKFGNLYFK